MSTNFVNSDSVPLFNFISSSRVFGSFNSAVGPKLFAACYQHSVPIELPACIEALLLISNVRLFSVLDHFLR